MGSFSQRLGYVQPPPDIRFRDDLPFELRHPIVRILREYASRSHLRSVVSHLFDPYGITPLAELGMAIQAEYNETEEALEFRRFLLYCPWNRVYDVIEELLQQLAFHENELAEPGERRRWGPLQEDLNQYFVHAGIGWQLENGSLLARGDGGFQNALGTAEIALRQSARPTSGDHIRAALSALSQRPVADTAGAVSRATSALESLLHDMTGEAMGLGDFLKKHPKLFHGALQKSLHGVYGFASDAGARHGKEGTVPSFEEAQFAVTTCAAACTLLAAANSGRNIP